MISTDFAPNEYLDDAALSLQLLFQPWRWQKGDQIQDAKNEIKNLFFNTTEAISIFLTGRAALYYYLQALNLPKNTDVMIQAFTCEAVPLPIIANGLNPIYVDIENQTFSMNIDDLQKKITPNVKVLILQHTFGFTPKFRNEILAFAKEKDLIVLEDLAHGFNPDILRNVSNKPPATSYLLSFGRSKAISSVFGGAIVTEDKSISDQLSKIEKQLSMPSGSFIIRALLYKPLTVLIKSTYDIYIGKILHKLLNIFNLLIPEITEKEKQGEYDTIFAKAYPNALAILLLHQLKKYPKTTKHREENTRQYIENLKSYKGATSYEPSAISHVTRFPWLVENRDEVLKKAAVDNVYLGKWYDQVVAPNSLDLEKVKYEPNSCPNAESVSNKIINLPLNINGYQVTKINNLLAGYNTD